MWRLLRGTAGLPGQVVSNGKSESEVKNTSLSDDGAMGWLAEREAVERAEVRQGAAGGPGGPAGGPSSSDDGGKWGEGTAKRAEGGGDASRIDSDGTGSGCGGTGALTKPILDVDFFFSLAISLMRRALRGPAVPLSLLHFLRRAGVSTNSLSGTTTSGLNRDATRDVCSHSVHFWH